MSEQSIIALVSIGLTTFVSILSIIQALFVSQKTNKIKVKEQETNLFYSNYYSAINELSIEYGSYHDHSTHKKPLLSAIYKIMIFSSSSLQYNLQELAKNVIEQSTTNPNYEKSDEVFYLCLSSLQKELGLRNIPGKQK